MGPISCRQVQALKLGTFMNNFYDPLRAIQLSLLGNITPNLRAAYLLLEKEKRLGVNYYYNNPLSEEEEELVSLTETELISLYSDDYEFDTNVEIISYPKTIPQKGFCVYHRYEKNYNLITNFSDINIEKLKKINLSSDPILILFYSAQIALLGNVTPNLRAVWTEENEANRMTFYYDQSLSAEEKELFKLASQKFTSEFPDGKANCAVEIIPYPKLIPQKGYCVYQRYEYYDE